jgi:hypothetical protein
MPFKIGRIRAAIAEQVSSVAQREQLEQALDYAREGDDARYWLPPWFIIPLRR